MLQKNKSSIQLVCILWPETPHSQFQIDLWTALQVDDWKSCDGAEIRTRVAGSGVQHAKHCTTKQLLGYDYKLYTIYLMTEAGASAEHSIVAEDPTRKKY